MKLYIQRQRNWGMDLKLHLGLGVLVGAIGVGFAAKQPHLELSAQVSCSCLDSQGNSAPFDVEIRSSAERSQDGWDYQYVFQNHRDRDIEVVVFFVQGDRVVFASSVITDNSKAPESQHGLGPLTILIPAKGRRAFKVVDAAPPVEVISDTRVLDEHGAMYGGGAASLYFPKWGRLFAEPLQ